MLLPFSVKPGSPYERIGVYGVVVADVATL